MLHRQCIEMSSMTSMNDDSVSQSENTKIENIYKHPVGPQHQFPIHCLHHNCETYFCGLWRERSSCSQILTELPPRPWK